MGINLTTVFWGLFRPCRALIVPNFVIGCILLLLILILIYCREVSEGLGSEDPRKPVTQVFFETVVRLMGINGDK